MPAVCPTRVKRLAPTLAFLCAAFVAPPALACGEALLEDTEAVAKLKEAEAALEQGDVGLARALAQRIERDSDLPVNRTGRIRALSVIRDRDASHDEVEQATSELTSLYTKHGGLELDQARGEGVARVGDAARAYAILAQYERSDVMVSAWGHAAIGRAARTVGDNDLARTAFSRCETTSTDAKICRGEYPGPPLLRGKAWAYAIAGFVLLLGAFLRKTARFAPWKDHAARPFAALVAAAAAVVFLFPRVPLAGIGACVVAVVTILFLQPRFFFRAARKGKVPDVVVRATTAEDASIPFVPFWLAHTNETIERVVHSPMYRTSAREPFLRIGKRPAPTPGERRNTKRHLVLALALISGLLSLAVAFVGFAAVF